MGADCGCTSPKPIKPKLYSLEPNHDLDTFKCPEQLEL